MSTARTPRVCVYTESQHRKLAGCVARNLAATSLDVTVVTHENVLASMAARGTVHAVRDLSVYDAFVVIVSDKLAGDHLLAMVTAAFDQRGVPVVAVLPPGTTVLPEWARGREVEYPDPTHTRVRHRVIGGLAAAGLMPAQTVRYEPDRPPLPAPDAPDAAQDPASFRAHYPKEIAPGTTRDLWFYAYRAAAADAAAADAAALLGPGAHLLRHPEVAAQSPVEPGARLVIRPEADGIAFDPEESALRFVRPWHRLGFRMTAENVASDTAVNGEILVQTDGLIVGRIPLIVVVTDDARSVASHDSANSLADLKVFASYSHCDGEVVTVVESAIRGLGIDVLRDRTAIPAGADWREEIERLIGAASLFQLFWSHSAAESEEVRKEWQFAKALVDNGQRDRRFIRPVYWQEPMPDPPEELNWCQFRFEDGFLKVHP